MNSGSASEYVYRNYLRSPLPVLPTISFTTLCSSGDTPTTLISHSITPNIILAATFAGHCRLDSFRPGIDSAHPRPALHLSQAHAPGGFMITVAVSGYILCISSDGQSLAVRNTFASLRTQQKYRPAADHPATGRQRAK
jgi:hypothetical protein